MPGVLNTFFVLDIAGNHRPRRKGQDGQTQAENSSNSSFSVVGCLLYQNKHLCKIPIPKMCAHCGKKYIFQARIHQLQWHMEWVQLEVAKKENKLITESKYLVFLWMLYIIGRSI